MNFTDLNEIIACLRIQSQKKKLISKNHPRNNPIFQQLVAKEVENFTIFRKIAYLLKSIAKKCALKKSGTKKRCISAINCEKLTTFVGFWQNDIYMTNFNINRAFQKINEKYMFFVNSW